LIVLNLCLIAIEGSGWRARYHLANFVKGCVVARAKILSLIGDPTDPTAKVSAYIRQGDIFTPIFREDIDRELFLGQDPPGLSFNSGLKK
jgi:hypothetical protein